MNLTLADIAHAQRLAQSCMAKVRPVAPFDAEASSLLAQAAVALNVLALQGAADYDALRDDAIEKRIRLFELVESGR